jgi:hypothetical protein
VAARRCSRPQGSSYRDNEPQSGLYFRVNPLTGDAFI